MAKDDRLRFRERAAEWLPGAVPHRRAGRRAEMGTMPHDLVDGRRVSPLT